MSRNADKRGSPLKWSGARDHAILEALAYGDVILRHRRPARRDDVRHYRNRGATASLTGIRNALCNLDGPTSECMDAGTTASR